MHQEVSVLTFPKLINDNCVCDIVTNTGADPTENGRLEYNKQQSKIQTAITGT